MCVYWVAIAVSRTVELAETHTVVAVAPWLEIYMWGAVRHRRRDEEHRKATSRNNLHTYIMNQTSHALLDSKLLHMMVGVKYLSF